MMVSADELLSNMSELLHNVRECPVVVQVDNEPTAVLLSHMEYQRLQMIDDTYWLCRAAEAEQRGLIGSD